MTQLLASLTLMLVCLVIGARLVALAARTRQTPELLIGVSFVLAGFFASGLDLVRRIAPVSETSSQWLAAGSTLCLHAGILLVAAFTWRVFRAEGRLGASLFAAAAVGLAIAAGGEIVARASLPAGAPNPWSIWLSMPLRIVIYVWATSEAFAYWARLRRRLRIGLADPLVVNRLLLWATGLLAIVVLWVRSLLVVLSSSEAQLTGSLLTTALVLVCAGAYWLAFFPPAAWRRRFASAV